MRGSNLSSSSVLVTSSESSDHGEDSDGSVLTDHGDEHQEAFSRGTRRVHRLQARVRQLEEAMRQAGLDVPPPSAAIRQQQAAPDDGENEHVRLMIVNSMCHCLHPSFVCCEFINDAKPAVTGLGNNIWPRMNEPAVRVAWSVTQLPRQRRCGPGLRLSIAVTTQQEPSPSLGAGAIQESQVQGPPQLSSPFSHLLFHSHD